MFSESDVRPRHFQGRVGRELIFIELPLNHLVAQRAGEISDKMEELEKLLRDVKLQKEKMSKELDNVPLIVCKLEKKPYDCKLTITWLTDKTADQKKNITVLLEAYISGKSLLEDLVGDDTGMEKDAKLSMIKEKKESIDIDKTTIEQSYAKYKTTVIGEFAKNK